MSLKELTKDKHTEAEATEFMKSVFKKRMPTHVWADYTYNKMLVYGAIETRCRAAGYLDDLPGIERTYALYQDAKEMGVNIANFKFKPETILYQQYLLNLDDPTKALAHLYTWHMGDLFGGQMIKKVLLNVPHRNLEFKDIEVLKAALRSKLDDSLADEANIAFAWAIKIMETYKDELSLANAG
jgi:heme oxygenase